MDVVCGSVDTITVAVAENDPPEAPAAEPVVETTATVETEPTVEADEPAWETFTEVVEAFLDVEIRRETSDTTTTVTIAKA